jgi:streptomycin 6-kinase
MILPKHLIANCRRSPERQAWLESLPAILEELTGRWVAPVVCADGAAAVLKLGMPHMEGAHEIQGLRFWNGNPTVRLLKADMALARCYLSAANPDTRFIPNRSTIKMR